MQLSTHKAPLIRITNSLLQKCAFILNKALKAKIAPMTILLGAIAFFCKLFANGRFFFYMF
jgi:hypothetical protein